MMKEYQPKDKVEGCRNCCCSPFEVRVFGRATITTSFDNGRDGRVKAIRKTTEYMVVESCNGSKEDKLNKRCNPCFVEWLHAVKWKDISELNGTLPKHVMWE